MKAQMPDQKLLVVKGIPFTHQGIAWKAGCLRLAEEAPGDWFLSIAARASTKREPGDVHHGPWVFAGRGATPEEALSTAPRRLRLLAGAQREMIARHTHFLEQILDALTHFPEEESP